MKQILIDTDILIDVFRGIEPAINRLQDESQTALLSISVVTEMELMVGCRNKSEQQKLTVFLNNYVILKINESISDQAVELLRQYRLSHGLLIPDALIAATTINFNIPLLTKNQSDYRFIKEVNLLPYP